MQTIIVTLLEPPAFHTGDTAVVTYTDPVDNTARHMRFRAEQLVNNDRARFILEALLHRYETHLCNPHGHRIVYRTHEALRSMEDQFVVVFEYDFETHDEVALADARSILTEYRDSLGADPGQSIEALASTVYAIFFQGATHNLIDAKVLAAAKIIYDDIMAG